MSGGNVSGNQTMETRCHNNLEGNLGNSMGCHFEPTQGVGHVSHSHIKFDSVRIPQSIKDPSSHLRQSHHTHLNGIVRQ